MGAYDIHGNERGKHGESVGVNTNTYAYKSAIKDELELAEKKHTPRDGEPLKEDRVPKKHTYDDWRKAVADAPPVHKEFKIGEYGNFDRKNSEFDKKKEKKSVDVIVNRINLVPQKNNDNSSELSRNSFDAAPDYGGGGGSSSSRKTPRSARDRSKTPRSARDQASRERTHTPPRELTQQKGMSHKSFNMLHNDTNDGGGGDEVIRDQRSHTPKRESLDAHYERKKSMERRKSIEQSVSTPRAAVGAERRKSLEGKPVRRNSTETRRKSIGGNRVYPDL
jgi:hypothetical protein